MTLARLFEGRVFAKPGISSGPAFGEAVARSGRPVVCFVQAAEAAAAHDYLDIIGCPNREIVTLDRVEDLSGLEASDGPDAIPLVVLPAVEPGLKDVFFRHPRMLLFADHLYRPAGGGATCLWTIGTTRSAVERLAPYVRWQEPRRARAARRAVAQAHFGPSYVDDGLTWSALASSSVSAVPVHGLGPLGTNIARACERFVANAGLGTKSTVTIHGRGVEPLEYAALAASQVQPSVLPLHVECAVFYDLKALFEQRRAESVFAAHLYMELDSMQLAIRPGARAPGPLSNLRVASHPSPSGLAAPLLLEGAELVTASSNADAAERVRGGSADVCVTTESGRRRAGLDTVHVFGSPTMLFTIGTPLGREALAQHAAAANSAAYPNRGLTSHQIEW